MSLPNHLTRLPVGGRCRAMVASPVCVAWPLQRRTTLLKGCTKTVFDPLRAASPQAAKASGARESLPQRILVALYATNLGQLLKDVPFFFVR